jgi:hypothetical protein
MGAEMNEIALSWSDFATTGLLLRLFGLVFGTVLLLHVMCMATKMSNKVPWTLAVLMGLNAATALGIVIGSIAGDFAFLANSAVMAIGADTGRQLWLWGHGMHVSDFIEKTYG